MQSDVIIDTIGTSNGRLINPFTVTAESGEFDINVIAHALSMQCRYAGHTSCHYSVAQHSLLVGQVIAARTWEKLDPNEFRRVQRWALVHDAEEAYLLDVPAPIKRRPEMQWYVDAGARLMGEIAKWLRLEGPEPDVVKRVDVEVRDIERFWLLPGHGKQGYDETASRYRIWRMSPEEARAAWLARFHELWPGWR